jgi:23S rRNA pseudouridine1911/1915/1917 synthase
MVEHQVSTSEMTTQTLVVEKPIRLDQFLVRLEPNLTRQLLQEIIQAGQVFINDQQARKPGQKLGPGDRVKAKLPEVKERTTDGVIPSRLPVPVLYEDEKVLVVEKPSGMPARPSPKHPEGTLLQDIAQRYPEIQHIGGVERGGMTHRVDTEISGPVLIARDKASYRELKRRVRRERFEWIYSALVEGQLSGEGTINQPVGNVKRRRNRLAVAREGRTARTHYRAQRHFKYEGMDYTLMEIQPETSRRHQIRVHLSWYGFPVVGDHRYGSPNPRWLIDRLFLHLSVLAFPHPETGEIVRIESPLPAELHDLLRYLSRPKL